MRLTLAMALMSLLVACKSDVPDLGRDLPPNFSDGERVFDQRVKARFPIGMSESELIAELQREGFDLRPSVDDVQDASFVRSQLIFQTIWSVRWRATAGAVSEVWGVYGGRAP